MKLMFPHALSNGVLIIDVLFQAVKSTHVSKYLLAEGENVAINPDRFGEIGQRCKTQQHMRIDEATYEA